MAIWRIDAAAVRRSGNATLLKILSEYADVWRDQDLNNAAVLEINTADFEAIGLPETDRKMLTPYRLNSAAPPQKRPPDYIGGEEILVNVFPQYFGDDGDQDIIDENLRLVLEHAKASGENFNAGSVRWAVTSLVREGKLKERFPKQAAAPSPVKATPAAPAPPEQLPMMTASEATQLVKEFQKLNPALPPPPAPAPPDELPPVPPYMLSERNPLRTKADIARLGSRYSELYRSKHGDMFKKRVNAILRRGI